MRRGPAMKRPLIIASEALHEEVFAKPFAILRCSGHELSEGVAVLPGPLSLHSYI